MNSTILTSLKMRLQQPHSIALLGTINAYTALLAQSVGAEAIYLSGAGVANASFGLPDIAVTNLTDLVEEAARITYACDCPLIVDIDTGFGSLHSIQRAIRLLERVGVAGVQIEDQVFNKRCGHLNHKQIVTIDDMQSRLKAVLDTRRQTHFLVIARTDAYAIEGITGTIARAQAYAAEGVDVIFPEALPDLVTFEKIKHNISVPILANCTEFGKTPLYTQVEYESIGVKMILYPLSAFRMMSQAAIRTYQTILQYGTQQSLIPDMQNRKDLYKILHYKE